MLPPVAYEVLNANPLFANLYTELTTRILDPLDGSTRSSSRPNDVLDQVSSKLSTLRASISCSGFPPGTPYASCRARENSAASEGIGDID